MKTLRKTISSKIAYKNPWYIVMEDKVIRPDGSSGKYFYIKRTPTVVVIPFEKNSIWLVEQFRYPLKQRTWELPMGTSEPDITLLSNAKKELKEETGFTARKWKKLGHFAWASGISSQLAHIYLATDLTAGQTKREPEEIDMKIKMFNLDQINNMIKKSIIIDDGTIAAIYHLNLLLKKS